jgi:steroid 5-alpha reductase family enzyme
MALPLDDYGYGLTAIITVFMQLFFFAIAYGCKFDLVTDLAGSSNFVLLVVLTLLLGPGGAGRARPLTLTALVTVTRAQLALFLLYRVCRRSKDARFDETRESFFRFLVFWIFQMFWAWLNTLPVIFVNSLPEDQQPPIGLLDGIGWATFALGFLTQVVADMQKYAFRADPANRGKFCSTGFWAVSRHPNYFGEIAMWWGIWISALSAIQESDSPGAAWVTLLGPLWTMFILLFLSGLPFAEGSSLARYYQDSEEGKRWDEYRERTSPVVPLPPALYARLPPFVKRGFFCEFKFLEYRSSSGPEGDVQSSGFSSSASGSAP